LAAGRICSHVGQVVLRRDHELPSLPHRLP
jgi:hypothetical protein